MEAGQGEREGEGCLTFDTNCIEPLKPESLLVIFWQHQALYYKKEKYKFLSATLT